MTPTDIFPRINIPVVSVIGGYTGLSINEMEKMITDFNDRWKDGQQVRIKLQGQGSATKQKV